MTDSRNEELQLKQLLRTMDASTRDKAITLFYEECSYDIKIKKIHKKVLYPNIIEEIKNREHSYIEKIKKQIKFKSDKNNRNTYYTLIYAALIELDYGVLNCRKGTKDIEKTWLAKKFNVDRRNFEEVTSFIEHYKLGNIKDEIKKNIEI